ncbi:integrin alpha-X isoform X4 [Lynx canadensis]|uniref:integrin alpha-X isoform X4 n=1 Tax=Lynx canadensis TaxID=61383 RepID=UPI0011AFF540|nr:integrin alpha-X isoform X4 [Lynx canadensis]
MTMIRTFLLLMGLASSLCFNLDTDQPTTFLMESAGFGYSVVQYANSWVVVGDPQEIKAANQTGSLYQCDYRTGKCEPIRLKIPPEAVNMSLGLSLAASTNPSQLLACGPTVHHTCKENMYLTGFCFLLVSLSWQAQRLPAALQECPRQEQDIVFLIDGSGSISFRDFTKMLNFVKAIMSQFQRPSTQFSLMQFSHHSWVHFTFKDFIYSSNPLGLLDSVQQLRGFTYTATAIQMVTNQLFSASSGARKDASKILIVITDGQKQGDPLGYEDVIPRAEAAGIIRYAVGVGLAFQNPHSRKELNDIASKPSHEHIFQVENFDALRDIQNQLKEKIFAIEGTQTISSSSFELEMSQEGFSAVFSPRISGSQLSPSLQYFGQSLSGGQDLTLDGLVDLAVGAQGQVMLLRTRPVLRVWMNIQFTSAEIARSVFECREETASVKALGDANVCLRIYESPKNQLGDLQSSVTFDLTLDPGRQNPRAIFEETKARNLTHVRVLGLRQYCETVRLLLLACVEDSVTPITLRLNFSLVGKPIPSFGNLQPILAVDAQRYFVASLPFEKNCGTDHVCQDDLGISFDFSGLKTLVVGSTLELNMKVTVWNDGEDSYGTTITFFYPPGLSYRRVAGSQNQLQAHSPSLTCDGTPAQGQSTQSTRCSINHLIFHEGAKMTFMVTFDVSPKAILGDRLLLTANVSSENTTPRTSKTTFQMELMVKYAIYTVISSHEESTKYLNFSALDWEESSQAQHRYQVNNLGQRDLPVSINFSVPVELNGVPVWTELGVFHPQNPSIQCSSERMVPIESDFLTHIQKNPVLNCSIADCLRFHCDLPSFGVQEELDFILKGNLSFGWVSQTLQKKVLIVSVAEIMFNTSVYAQLPGQEAFLRAQMEMVLEKYEVYNTVPIIVGSSLGGLLLLALITVILYKVGFFKRQYKEMMEEANGQTIPENGTSDPQASQ